MHERTMTRSSTVILLLVAAFVAANNSLHPLSDEFISQINSKQSSWTAGRNFSPNTSLTYIKKLVGVIKSPLISILPVKMHDADLIASLPENFDAREKWPNCPSLNEIVDQGSCASSWAFAVVGAMTDRVCTYSNGTKHFHFSADDLMSCCKECIDIDGCIDGEIRLGWQYWQDYGIVSGGSYNSSQGCRPYGIPPCEHHVDGNRPKCEDKVYYSPECVHKCEDGYSIEYDQDKHHGISVYKVGAEDNIKAELYTDGPVSSTLHIYEDFLHYKSGVYSHTSGEDLGQHNVKILGWGIENGTKYWLCANSWNTDWGDKGFFKTLRGEPDSLIEDRVVAGDPDLTGI